MLRSLGVTVTSLPYELHPEIPVGGISLKERWGARYGEASAMYARIEKECEQAGLPFRRPARVPNTRRALETAEWVRRNQPTSFDSLERALFDTHFIENRPLDDPEVLDELVSAAGADAVAARVAVDEGAMLPALRESMDAAMDANVTGTPAWLLDGRLLIPGAQSRDLYEIWVQRLRQRDPDP
ncbi:MAG: DsbA family protein [Acidimicrobiia bacterium]|nr:DsbA family protein [Acidimicrobiia bacterium]